MSTDLQVIQRSPKNEVSMGQAAAQELMRVVKEMRWARKFGGEREHLEVEAWQMLGRFDHVIAQADDAEPVEIDGVKGCRATATLFDEEGRTVGKAIAYCLRDEPNWRNKPWFQLASMAQTRAISKAFRNRLAWIARLAGYSGTPAEEMEGVNSGPPPKPSGKKFAKELSAEGEKKATLTLEERKINAVNYIGTKVGMKTEDAIVICENYLKSSYDAWTQEDLDDLKTWAKAGCPPPAPPEAENLEFVHD